MSYKISIVGEVQALNKKENFIKYNSDIFTDVGKFPDKVRIKIKENSIPVMSVPKRVLIKLMGKFKELIDRLCKQNVISKCEPSEWLHNLVIIGKPDNFLLMCLDLKN